MVIGRFALETNGVIFQPVKQIAPAQQGLGALQNMLRCS
jgi:hypothetical protein